MPEYSPINLERQQVDDLVITCADHRFQAAFETLLEENEIMWADRLAFPGPSKAIAEETLLPAIKKLEELHGFTNIHILDHTDCGAFGGLEKFDWDEQKEAEAHFKYLRLATEVIHRVLPHITIVEHVVGIHGEIKVGSDSHLAPSR